MEEHNLKLQPERAPQVDFHLFERTGKDAGSTIREERLLTLHTLW